MSDFSAQNSPDERVVLTISSVCKLLDLSRSSVVRLLDAGVIPSRDLLGRVVVLRDELDAALRKLPPAKKGTDK
jgi:excisionase family DNA binding protein